MPAYTDKTLRDYLNKDLSEQQRAEIKAAVQADEALAERVAALHDKLPPEATPQAERPGSRTGKRSFLYWLKHYRYGAIAMIVLAVLTLIAYWWLA